MNGTIEKQDNGLPVSRREKLKEFYLGIKNCTKCALAETRTNFVFGSGNPDSRILLVGEAPGKNEDLQGRPFVGQAGKLLDELLESAGFSRSGVFIANVLKCRPPLNRDPLTSEIDLCKPYLFKQIEIIDPEVICTMGRYSTQLLLESTAGISSLRGSIYKKNGRIILPINHPAAALYTRSRMQVLKEDFKRLRQIMDMIMEGNDKDMIINSQLNKAVGENPAAGISEMSPAVKAGTAGNPGDAVGEGQGRQLGLF